MTERKPGLSRDNQSHTWVLLIAAVDPPGVSVGVLTSAPVIVVNVDPFATQANWKLPSQYRLP